MSEKKAKLILIKEFALNNMIIKWYASPLYVDFGIYVFLKEKPPALVRLILEYFYNFTYNTEPVEKIEGYEGGEFYYGEGIALTHLGCTIPVDDKDIENNTKIIEKNKEGLAKFYEGVWSEVMTILKKIDDNWEKIKEINQKFFEMLGVIK